MVRYSIEAGLLGPGVRIVARRRCSRWRCWRRRMDAPQGEHLAAIAPLPIANIPAILTAAGTAVAFAHRLRRLCAVRFPRCPPPPSSCSALVALGTLAAALLHGPALAGLGVVGRLRHAGAGLVRQAGLLGALHLSRHRHRGGVRAGAHPAVALARGHHHRLRLLLDSAGIAEVDDGRAARVPRHRRLRARRAAGGVRFLFGPPADEARSSRSRPARWRSICSARR